MNKKLCFIMYVAGERYYPYIPFFLHSVIKAYPEHFTFIGIKGVLPDKIKWEISQLDGSKFHIFSEVFSEWPDDPDIVKTLRWLWFEPSFLEFENIYIGDIDILITREQPGILERNLGVCEDNGSDYANTTGIDPIATRGLRMTGLHFAHSRPYFEKMLPVMTHYRRILREKMPQAFFNDKLAKYDNQMALAIMMVEAGYTLQTHGHFEYNGLHLGHSRVKNRWEQLFKTDPNHRAYFKEFLNYCDEDFKVLLASTTPEVRDEINLMIKAGREYA
jgi:hypothetical protein